MTRFVLSNDICLLAGRRLGRNMFAVYDYRRPINRILLVDMHELVFLLCSKNFKELDIKNTGRAISTDLYRTTCIDRLLHLILHIAFPWPISQDNVHYQGLASGRYVLDLEYILYRRMIQSVPAEGE